MKPMASLSSGLLARKGQAKPAMRPQGFVNLTPTGSYDDLGWNDMGDDSPAPMVVTAPVEKPVVLRQIEAIEQQISQVVPIAAPPPEPVLVVAPQPVAVSAPQPVAASKAVRKPRAAPLKNSKAAFTLRLDADRHLRLRLASAVTNRSAQQLVTAALDAFLESHTEVEALARQLDPAKDHG